MHERCHWEGRAPNKPSSTRRHGRGVYPKQTRHALQGSVLNQPLQRQEARGIVLQIRRGQAAIVARCNLVCAGNKRETHAYRVSHSAGRQLVEHNYRPRAHHLVACSRCQARSCDISVRALVVRRKGCVAPSQRGGQQTNSRAVGHKSDASQLQEVAKQVQPRLIFDGAIRAPCRLVAREDATEQLVNSHVLVKRRNGQRPVVRQDV